MNNLTIKISRKQLDTILLALKNDIEDKKEFFNGFKTTESKIKYFFSYNYYISCKKILNELLKV